MKLSDKFIMADERIADFDNVVPAPYIRKKFALNFIPKCAEITICGLGFYELYINGKNITKGEMAPYISNTDDICCYDNYDIAPLLKEGDNAIGIILGNGFRNAYGGFIWDFDKAASRGSLVLALCLEAWDEENNFILEADDTFKTASSPILYNDLRMGYCYDARLEIPGWCDIDFDDSEWKNVKKAEKPRGKARICTAEPIVCTDELAAKEVTHYESLAFLHEDSSPEALAVKETVRESVYVFDFGVNSAGVTKLAINGEPGQVLKIRHGEHLVGGEFDIRSVSFMDRDETTVERYINYGQKDVFICKGGYEEFVPKFKYDGFRYAYVEGLKAEQVNENTLKFLVMNSDIKERGGFNCSDEVLNKLFECARRSDLSNFYYFPTDCPHREKNGWTGDAALSAEHMMLTLTPEKSFREWLVHISAAQTSEGVLPGIVPTGGWGFDWGNGPAWDCVLIELPYYIYKYTGNIDVIIENTPLIMRYLCYINSRRDKNGLLEIGLGDWNPPFKDEGKELSPLIFTDSVVIFDLAKKASYLLKKAGKKEESLYAEAVADSMRASIRNNLIDFETMTVIGNCQSSQVIGIYLGIFDDNELAAAKAKLLEIIHRDGDINTCGTIGIRYMYHLLSDMGESELALKIIKSKERSCYGYWIENGATSLWESFVPIDGKMVDSRNHHFFGDISSWMIQKIAGLHPNPNVDDVNYFEIAPCILSELDYASAYYNSQKGKISSEWKRENGKVTLTVTAPDGVHGKVRINNTGYELTAGCRTYEIKE